MGSEGYQGKCSFGAIARMLLNQMQAINCGK